MTRKCTVAPRGPISFDGSMRSSSVKTMFIEDPEGSATWEFNVLSSRESDGYRVVTNQIPHLVPVSPTIVRVMPEDLHLVGTTRSLTIVL